MLPSPWSHKTNFLAIFSHDCRCSHHRAAEPLETAPLECEFDAGAESLVRVWLAGGGERATDRQAGAAASP